RAPPRSGAAAAARGAGELRAARAPARNTNAARRPESSPDRGPRCPSLAYGPSASRRPGKPRRARSAVPSDLPAGDGGSPQAATASEGGRGSRSALFCWSSGFLLAAGVGGAWWPPASPRPPQRPGWLLMFGFFAAWWTTELAPLHLLWQLAAVVVFIALGALNAWPGWVALAITVASWCGLVWSVRGSWGTDRTLASAFRAGLGPGWDAGLSRQQVAAHRRKEWARVLLPFWFKRRGVTVTRNIQYVAGDTARRHRLDVYTPVDAAPGAPVILQIHGGGWVIGNKSQQGLPLMYHLASRGWVCVAINYRLSPRATWPDHLVDCKQALAWI